jgi:hypothetical protein
MTSINYKVLVEKLIDEVLIEYGLHEPRKLTTKSYMKRRDKALKEIKDRINALELTLEVPK